MFSRKIATLAVAGAVFATGMGAAFAIAPHGAHADPTAPVPSVTVSKVGSEVPAPVRARKAAPKAHRAAVTIHSQEDTVSVSLAKSSDPADKVPAVEAPAVVNFNPEQTDAAGGTAPAPAPESSGAVSAVGGTVFGTPQKSTADGTACVDLMGRPGTMADGKCRVSS